MPHKRSEYSTPKLADRTASAASSEFAGRSGHLVGAGSGLGRGRGGGGRRFVLPAAAATAAVAATFGCVAVACSLRVGTWARTPLPAASAPPVCCCRWTRACKARPGPEAAPLLASSPTPPASAVLRSCCCNACSTLVAPSDPPSVLLPTVTAAPSRWRVGGESRPGSGGALSVTVRAKRRRSCVWWLVRRLPQPDLARYPRQQDREWGRAGTLTSAQRKQHDRS